MKLKVEKFGSFVKIIWMFELNWRRKSSYLLLLLDIIRNVCFHWCAKCNVKDRKNMWHSLFRLNPSIPCLICGDFVSDYENFRGMPFSKKAKLEFRDFISANYLYIMPNQGSTFTWFVDRDGVCMREVG